MNRLPNHQRAILDVRKLGDYCLNPGHPRGRHKARVFRNALGIERGEAAWLRSKLLEGVGSAEAAPLSSDSPGNRWRIDVPVTRQNKQVVISSIWMVRTGEDIPRFVTCWVL